MNDSRSSSYRVSEDPIIRFCAFYLLLYLGSLILGGIGVFEIVFGLLIASTRILVRIPYFQPLVTSFLGFKKPEPIKNKPHSLISRAIALVINLVMIGFYGAISIFLIRMGVNELLDKGFLNQNLIYMLFFK